MKNYFERFSSFILIACFHPLFIHSWHMLIDALNQDGGLIGFFVVLFIVIPILFSFGIFVFFTYPLCLFFGIEDIIFYAKYDDFGNRNLTKKNHLLR